MLIFHTLDLFAGIRQYFGQKAIDQALLANKRIKKYISLEQARNIGILYEWNGTNYHRLMQSLKDTNFAGHQVHILGYYSQAPAKTEAPARGVFSRKDLDWKLIPTECDEVKRFLERQYDILFDLSAIDYIPLLYVLAGCQTGLTISLFSEKKKALSDMMIHLPENAEMEIILKHMTHYLHQIQAAK